MSKIISFSIFFILIVSSAFAEDRERNVFTGENISIRIGERTWISYGKSDRNHAASDGSPDVLSELIYNDVDSVITEFNVNALLYNRYFFSVDVGIGGIDGGKLTDRDYLGDNRTELFSVSDSTVDDDNVFYVNADIGYRIFNKKKSSIDLLLGYQHWGEKYIAIEGRQTVDPFNLVGLGPFANQGRGISQKDTWDSLRVGVRAKIELFPKLSIKSRLIFVPWTHYESDDIHYLRSDLKKDPSFEIRADGGFGVMSDTTISYNIWNGLSVEAGYQIWDIDSGSGTLTSKPLAAADARTRFNETNTTRQGGIIGLYYTMPPVYAKRDITELKYGKMSFTLESSGKFLSRRDNFGYVYNAQNASPSSYTGRERPNYDSLGGGGKIVVDYNINDKDSIEFSFQGASAGSDSTRRIVADLNGSLPVVPVIDGRSFGTNQHFLSFVGNPDGTPNIRVKFEYETWYVDTFLGLNRTMYKKDNTELHGIVGLSYAHFEQDFKHKMTGEIPFIFPVFNHSILGENIRDNLFGLKGGIRLSSNITRKFQVEGAVFGGAYYRKSKLEADQELIHAGIPFTLVTTNVFASVNDRDSHFVPRAEGNLKVKYKINERWNLAFSSGVGSWWHMSNVNNPEPASGNLSNTGTPIDRPVHIGGNDRLIEYHAGLAITFRH